MFYISCPNCILFSGFSNLIFICLYILLNSCNCMKNWRFYIRYIELLATSAFFKYSFWTILNNIYLNFTWQVFSWVKKLESAYILYVLNYLQRIAYFRNFRIFFILIYLYILLSTHYWNVPNSFPLIQCNRTIAGFLNKLRYFMIIKKLYIMKFSLLFKTPPL